MLISNRWEIAQLDQARKMGRCLHWRLMVTESQFAVLARQLHLHLYGTAETECSKFKAVIELGVKTAFTIICTIRSVTLKVIIKYSSLNLIQRAAVWRFRISPSSNVYADICIARLTLSVKTRWQGLVKRVAIGGWWGGGGGFISERGFLCFWKHHRDRKKEI